MKLLDSNLACPSCHEALQPKILACPHCEIKMEGPFQFNEFALLSAEDLHFLRIFVRSEGRIRDMESALGLSYPTIRARITALKHKLAGDESETIPEPHSTGGDPKLNPKSNGEPSELTGDVRAVLQGLEAGKIPFAEAMERIRRLKIKS